MNFDGGEALGSASKETWECPLKVQDWLRANDTLEFIFSQRTLYNIKKISYFIIVRNFKKGSWLMTYSTVSSKQDILIYLFLDTYLKGGLKFYNLFLFSHF